ncbi:hypothetical protein BKA93DRAFT_218659 [Sparassis latifolia]
MRSCDGAPPTAASNVRRCTHASVRWLPPRRVRSGYTNAPSDGRRVLLGGGSPSSRVRRRRRAFVPERPAVCRGYPSASGQRRSFAREVRTRASRRRCGLVRVPSPRVLVVARVFDVGFVARAGCRCWDRGHCQTWGEGEPCLHPIGRAALPNHCERAMPPPATVLRCAALRKDGSVRYRAPRRAGALTWLRMRGTGTRFVGSSLCPVSAGTTHPQNHRPSPFALRPNQTFTVRSETEVTAVRVS